MGYNSYISYKSLISLNSLTSQIKKDAPFAGRIFFNFQLSTFNFQLAYLFSTFQRASFSSVMPCIATDEIK